MALPTAVPVRSILLFLALVLLFDLAVFVDWSRGRGWIVRALRRLRSRGWLWGRLRYRLPRWRGLGRRWLGRRGGLAGRRSRLACRRRGLSRSGCRRRCRRLRRRQLLSRWHSRRLLVRGRGGAGRGWRRPNRGQHHGRRRHGRWWLKCGRAVGHGGWGRR